MENIIIGIDPGQNMGVGVLINGKYHSHTVIRGKGKTRADIMGDIARKLDQIVYDITAMPMAIEMAIEAGYVGKYASAALSLGESRGVAMATAAIHGISVVQYEPSKVKMAVGYGGASKKQVGNMVCSILGLEKRPPQDACDALAVAICHLHRL